MPRWWTPTGSRPTSTTPRWSSSRSTRTPRPTPGTTSPAPSGSTGRRTCRTRSAATSSTGRHSRRCCPPRASATTTPSCSTAATTTGSRPTPTGTSSSTATSDVRLLDGGRKKWELDGRELTAEVPERPATTYAAQEQDPRSARSAMTWSAAIGSAEPGRRPLARRVLRQAARPGPPAAGAVAARRPHPERAATSRGPRRPTTTAPSSRDDELRALYAEEGVDFAGTPSPTAASASGRRTPGSCCTRCSAQPNVKNYDGSWTEYGSLVGVPIALGEEPGSLS